MPRASSSPGSPSGIVPQSSQLDAARQPVDVDPALACGRHRSHAVVDAVILHRRLERSARRIAIAAAGPHVQGQRIVVDAQRRHRRAVIGLRIVDGPPRARKAPKRTRYRRPRYRRSMRFTPCAATWSARSSMAASGSPATGPGGREWRAPERLGSPPPTSRSVAGNASGGIRRRSASTRVWKVKSGPRRDKGQGGGEQLGVGCGDEQMAGISLVHTSAASQVDDPDSPERRRAARRDAPAAAAMLARGHAPAAC